MNSDLIASWVDHDNAVLKILAAATKTLRVFDEDLRKLQLERRESTEILKRFFASDRHHTLQIIVKNADPFLRKSPRLLGLFREYPESMSIVECPLHLSSLNDSLLIADRNHALVRFHKDNVRSKAIINDNEKCIPYLHRFEEIEKEGGEPISSTPLGL